MQKLGGNARRDKSNRRALTKLGWRVVVVWECETERLEDLEIRLRRKTDALFRSSELGR